MPVEQRVPERRFQLRQRRAHRRLLQAELLAGGGGGFALRDGGKHSPLAQRDTRGFVIHKTGHS